MFGMEGNDGFERDISQALGYYAVGGGLSWRPIPMSMLLAAFLPFGLGMDIVV
jgi:hypothetical protein